MKFAHIIHAVYNEPWLISDAGHDSIVRLLESRLARDSMTKEDAALVLEHQEAEAKEAGKVFGAKPPMQVSQDGVATIPIHGTIAKGISNLARACGACGIEDIHADLAEACSRPDVKAIVLAIDSPGGSVSGVPELAAFVRACSEKKPIVAFTDGMMASAAYWIGSQASEVIASTSASVGSIGVFIPYVDRSRAAEMQGMKVEVIKNKEGSHKGIGIPGTALTDSAREYMQEHVQDLFDMFKASILASRPNVPAAAMTGKTYMANKAKQNGLCDTVGSIETAHASALALCGLKQKLSVR